MPRKRVGWIFLSIAVAMLIVIPALLLEEQIFYEVTPTVLVAQGLICSEHGPATVICQFDWRPRWPAVRDLPHKRAIVSFHCESAEPRVSLALEDLSTPIRIYGRGRERRRAWTTPAPQLTHGESQRLVRNAADLVAAAADGRSRVRSLHGKRWGADTTVPEWWRTRYHR